MLNLNKTKITPQNDPNFYSTLKKLTMKEKLKYRDHRVDGRKALNEFILEDNSITKQTTVNQLAAITFK